jgi:hypothetical protein
MMYFKNSKRFGEYLVVRETYLTSEKAHYAVYRGLDTSNISFRRRVVEKTYKKALDRYHLIEAASLTNLEMKG